MRHTKGCGAEPHICIRHCPPPGRFGSRRTSKSLVSFEYDPIIRTAAVGSHMSLANPPVRISAEWLASAEAFGAPTTSLEPRGKDKGAYSWRMPPPKVAEQ